MQLIGKLRLFAIILFGLACKAPAPLANSTNESSATSSIDGKWIVIELNGRKVNEVEWQIERPRLEFDSVEKRVAGTTGCNQFGATFTVTGTTVKIGVGAATRMFCPGDLEDRFLKAIGVVNEFKIENLSLHLMEDNNVRMTLRRPD